MALYNRRTSLMGSWNDALNRMRPKPYRLMGLGQDPAADAAAVTDAAAVAADAAAAAADAAAVVAAVADPAAMQAEIDRLKKENESLKKSMAKFLMGAAVGAVGGYWWRGRRSF